LYSFISGNNFIIFNLNWLPNTEYDSVYNNKRTTTMTFRIDKSIMDKLRVEANNRGISLNMLVNQIIKNFVDWYMFEPKIGMIPLSKPVVIELFRNLKEEEVLHIATGIGKNAIYDIALFMKTRIDMDLFLEWFESRMKNSSMHISHIVNGHTHTYTMKHDICLNWSLYYKTILDLIFYEIFKKRVDINISEGSFTITFEK
jgi:hypothetical protein